MISRYFVLDILCCLCDDVFQFANQYSWNFTPIGLCGWYLSVLIQAYLDIDDDKYTASEKRSLVSDAKQSFSVH